MSNVLTNGRTLTQWLDATLVPRIQGDDFSNRATAVVEVRLRGDHSSWSWDVWLQMVRWAAEAGEPPK